MTNKPAAELRDGLIKATIWRNTSEKGDNFYSLQFTNAYRDRDGNYRDSKYYAPDEALRLAILAGDAYRKINALKFEDRQTKAQAEAVQTFEGTLQ